MDGINVLISIVFLLIIAFIGLLRAETLFGAVGAAPVRVILRRVETCIVKVLQTKTAILSTACYF